MRAFKTQNNSKEACVFFLEEYDYEEKLEHNT